MFKFETVTDTAPWYLGRFLYRQYLKLNAKRNAQPLSRQVAAAKVAKNILTRVMISYFNIAKI